MDNSNLGWLIVGVVVAIGLAVAIVFAIRRHRYIRSITDRGWRFVNSPTLAIVDQLNVPPFGLGFRRETDEQVIGSTSTGVPFQAFDYDYPGNRQRLVTMPLPMPLPELMIGLGDPRPGLAAAHHGERHGWQVYGDHPEFTDAFVAMIAGPLQAYAARFPLNLTVDGRHLTMTGAPVKAEELAPFTEALGAVVSAVDASGVEPFRQPEPVGGFRFYRRPGWTFHAEDLSFLDRVRHNTGGFGHAVSQVVTGEEPGLSFIALIHEWKTTRTETYTDSEGRTQTRTVTDHHSEEIFETYLPFSWPYLKVGPDRFGPGWFEAGEEVQFESEQFNREFDVRAEHSKFAYDVVHPRQMEYLLALRPPSIEIRGATALFHGYTHSPESIGFCLDVLRGFLARVPSFVWTDLQITPPDWQIRVG